MSEHILVFEKHLHGVTPIPHVYGVALRSFQQGDADPWLRLHQQCFGSPEAGRQWQQADFDREFLDKDWWNPSRFWIAVTENGPVGSVVIGNRTGAADCGALLWLMTAVDHRRRGIGGMLVCLAEQVSFELGHQRIGLETLSSWQDAISLYRSLGYVASRDRRP